MEFNHSLILFYSSNYTMWANNVLQDDGIICKLVAVPREISSNCGHCIKIEFALKEKAHELLTRKHVKIDRIVDI
ncbi:MAG: hypothetical protein COB07_05705 [Sulfurovum sp.]|nr:MAG: hypothetical protein COB07_12190 [Sulfurovum sp.]PHS39890.1 MAG: hypothetical protein COB07_05705 [Sulfurovum sp.]